MGLNRKFVFVSVLLMGLGLVCHGQSQVKDTKHNLSVSGPGRFKSTSETEICKFCHTPHSAKPRNPLWNHELSAVSHYRTYRSPSFEPAVQGDQALVIDGTSRLCLSCHDGTVALGAMVNGKGKNNTDSKRDRGLGAMPPSARGFIGTDLSGSHPISFSVSESLVARNNAKDTLLNSLAEMKADPDVHLDENGKVQCTTCHSVHSDKNFQSSGIHFWAKQSFNDVCTVCHRL